MKDLKILTFLLLPVMLIACHSRSENNIPGFYVSSFKNEYGLGKDTLVITSFNEDTQVYQIEHRESVQYIRKGKALPVEYQSHAWLGTYIKAKQLLQESEFERQIYFQSGFKVLRFGRDYQKIK